MKDFNNKRLAILGLGTENVALVRYLLRQGAKIVVCDEKQKGELGESYRKVKDWPIQFRLGPHYLDHLEDFEVIFRTPGLPYLHPKIQAAKKAGVKISSQIKLFFELCPSPICGVTGTKGKGTTATLISKILEWKIQNPKSKFQTNFKSQIPKSKIFLGGNIGNPPTEFLDELTKDDIVILELSSFQLQDLERSPHIAVVLDVKVDHLNYHRDEKEYIEAKQNIVRHQKKNDYAVINADYLTSFEFGSLTPAEIYWFSRRKSVDQGVWIKNQKFILRIDDRDFEIADVQNTLLKGEHNLENICAAITASYLAGAALESIKKAVKTFRGLEHRLEFIKEASGVKFYNDSFSTTPETCIAAIKSFAEPIILLIGGSEKNADYSELGKAISKSSVKAVINIGQTGLKIIEKIANPQIKIIRPIQSMEGAVERAKKLALKGDVVLLSPASASFDRFLNYKERGEIFKKEINQ